MPAELSSLAEKPGGRNDDAGLALDRLDEECAGVGIDGVAQGLDVAVGDDPEPRCEGAEAIAIMLVGREANDGDGAAVEVAGADNDLGLVLRDALDFVAPLARGLDRRFNCLGAGVHREDHVEAGEVVEILAEQRQLLVAKRARGQSDFAGLLLEGAKNLGVAVSLIDCRIGGETVEITLPFDVIDPHALGALNHDVERVIIVRSVFVFQVDEVLGTVGRINLQFSHDVLSAWPMDRSV